MPDFNQMQRQRLAAKNQAMPDGSFPIRNVADLKRAIQAYGRAKNKTAAKAWIIKRAKQLGATELLPESWKSDSIQHYGILGMKWGQRRFQNKNGGLTAAGKKRYKYTSMSTKRYAKKVAKNKEKAAEHRRYAEDYNPKNYIGRSKYTDKQRARDQKNMDKELRITKKYDAKAKKMQTRQKRSAEHDAKMQAYSDQRSTGEAFVKTLIASNLTLNIGAYKSYMQNQASGMSKGKAAVATMLGGNIGAMYVKHRYITQDERKKK